jgi:hypothetical protein
MSFTSKGAKEDEKDGNCGETHPPCPMPTPPTLDLSVVSPIFASDLFV